MLSIPFALELSALLPLVSRAHVLKCTLRALDFAAPRRKLNCCGFTAQQFGFTLIELLIALSIGTFILTTMVAFYGTTIKHARENLNMGRFNQEMFLALNLMAKDIQRAGFWGQATTAVNNDTNTNPFTAATTNVQISGNTCILFSYDKNGDGAIPAVGAGDDERYGYRLNGNTIQMRTSTSPYDCAAAANTWETLTDVNTILVTNLTFTQSSNTLDVDGSGPSTATITQREIVITLSGQAAGNAQITRTLTQTVKVHNDWYRRS